MDATARSLVYPRGMDGLYEALGGDAGMATVVEEFYLRVMADSELAPYFVGVDLERLRGHQQAFLRAAIDGPGRYEGRPLGPVHAGLRITDAHFDRLVEHLAATLRDLGAGPGAVAFVRGRVDALRPHVASM